MKASLWAGSTTRAPKPVVYPGIIALALGLSAGCLQDTPPIEDHIGNLTGGTAPDADAGAGAEADTATDTALADVASDADVTSAPDITVDPQAPDTSDATGDAATGTDAEGDTQEDADTEVASGPMALTIEIPVSPPLDAAFPVLIDGPPAFSGEVQLEVQGEPRSVLLHRGRGSFSTTVTDPGTFTVLALGDAAVGEATAEAEARPERLLTGALAGADLAWDDGDDVRIEGVVTVPSGAFLTIGPDTRVFAEPTARLEVAGTLMASGPSLFTQGGVAPWGGLVVHQSGSAMLTDVWFLGGGGDATKTFGHSDSQPVVKVSNATLTLTGGGILDSVGKGLGAFQSTLSAQGLLISRCDTGGEIVQSSLTLSDSHVVEIPDADGIPEDDDNDGMYFVGALEVGGSVVGSTLTDVVFALGEDDGVDQNNAAVTISRGWFEGLRHECVATSGGRSVLVEDSVLLGCDQGIEVGYDAPAVEVRNCLLTGHRVGLRFGDDYDWEDLGTLTVSHTVSVLNTEANVLNLMEDGTAKPGAIQIACSMVDDEAFDESDGNLPGVPTWTPAGCVDAPTCDSAPIGPDVCE